MRKQLNIIWDEELHIAAKKRTIDLKMNFATYITQLVELELEKELLSPDKVMESDEKISKQK